MNHAAVVLAYNGDGAGVAVMAKKTCSTEEFFLRKESQVYCDEGGGNFDVINYVVVVEGNEGYHRKMIRGMELLLVTNLDKAQVKSTVLRSLKFSRVRTFKS
ncbi:hypothetical protein D5086_032903 [Populus alba]|uniref:Uncharacterized protein n=1 Tax=Populus alba TaxID=43335 RepID=A0ACC4AFA9_POPAL